MKRPPERRSIVAVCLARMIGSRWAMMHTPVPSRMVDVEAAAAVSAVNGSSIRGYSGSSSPPAG
jgi:hypothetical protein